MVAEAREALAADKDAAAAAWRRYHTQRTHSGVAQKRKHAAAAAEENAPSAEDLAVELRRVAQALSSGGM